MMPKLCFVRSNAPLNCDLQNSQLLYSVYESTRFDRGYRGINLTIISSHSQIFELQFHTEESFHLKTQTHNLYKKLRSSAVSWAEKKQIFQKLVEMAKEVDEPKGVKNGFIHLLRWRLSISIFSASILSATATAEFCVCFFYFNLTGLATKSGVISAWKN